MEAANRLCRFYNGSCQCPQSMWVTTDKQVQTSASYYVKNEVGAQKINNKNAGRSRLSNRPGVSLAGAGAAPAWGAPQRERIARGETSGHA
jgi:hypothetical protein